MALIDALNTGRRELVITLGGSATNDAGLGMLMALGMLAFNEQGEPVEPNLSGLLCVNNIDLTGLDPRLSECRLTILSDVVSPLCGKNGATTVYGPQKGIETSELSRVDNAIADFSVICAAVFGSDPSSKAGAGAAGGLGYALMLLGGEVVSGAEYVINATGLRDQLADADWVITGEGCSDMQTLQGKLPYCVALVARDIGVKVALLSGSIEKDALSDLEKEFDLVVSAKPEDMSNEVAIARAETVLTEAAAQLARIIHGEH